MPRKSLDALEAEIRATRARLAALFARADRDYAFRPVLRALRRGARHDLAVPAPTPEAGSGKGAGRLAPPAALLGFALALVTLRRRRPEDAAEEEVED